MTRSSNKLIWMVKTVKFFSGMVPVISLIVNNVLLIQKYILLFEERREARNFLGSNLHFEEVWCVYKMHEPMWKKCVTPLWQVKKVLNAQSVPKVYIAASLTPK